MKKLDFSGISTEKLRYAAKETGCFGIGCEDDDCPFGDICKYIPASEIIEAFKQELNRREKDVNTMPELKAGMIVEWMDFGTTRKSLYINDEVSMTIDAKLWTSGDLSGKDIIKIYDVPACAFSSIGDWLSLIWSRKSDKDIKIEEIQNTIKELQNQVDELQGA